MLARRTEPLPGNRAKSARPRPLFYGWYVVAAAFAVTFIGFGCAYSFGAFVRSLEEDFGASRGSVSAVFSLAGFLYFGLGTVSGPLADRWGSRRLVLLGMLLTGFGLAMASLARNLMEIYAAYGLGIGLGVGFSYVPALAAVQRWFDRRRGLASGLAVSGIGTGTLSMPPLASYLIGELGWRAAYLVLALLAVAIGASMALLLKDDPSECGLAADGTPVRPGRRPPQPVGARLLEALRSRQFVGLYLACLVCSFGVFLPFVHLVPYALERGIAEPSAVLLLALIGVGSVLGRFVLGSLADQVGRRQSLILTYVCLALAFAGWSVSAAFWSLAIFALAFGMFYGGWVAVLPAIAVDYFGARNASGIIGVLFASAGLGILIGPAAGGYIVDAYHSYAGPILAAAGANIIAACIAARTTAPRGEQR